MSELLDKKSLGTFMFINIYIGPLCYMTLGVCSQAYSTYPKWQVCNIFAISQKKVKGEVNFLQAEWVCVDRHAQITLNNKCASSLQFLKKEVSDKVDFIHEEKHESFQQIDVSIFDEDGQAFPKFPI